MFGRRRIRQLEAEIAVLITALDFYAINDNWKRRSKYSTGRHWAMSPAGQDHGGRAREALLKAKAIRRGAVGRLIDDVRAWFHARRDAAKAKRSIANAAEHLKHRVTVPAPLTPTPDSRPIGETA